MSEKLVLCEVAESLMQLTLNRPEKLNAITQDMLEDIRAALLQFRDTETLRVLVFKSTGKFFSAGMDVSGGLGAESNSGAAFRNGYRTSLHTILDEMEAIEKPIVFAIHAPCMGGALEMALSADFRLCSDKANFSLPEINLGIIPGSGGCSRLTRLVGTAWAKWMVMAAQKVSAEKAAQIGLVQDVYSANEFDQRVSGFVAHLAALPPETMGLAKVTIETVKDLDRASARSVERMANSWLIKSDEHKTLVDRFNQRKNKS